MSRRYRTRTLLALAAFACVSILSSLIVYGGATGEPGYKEIIVEKGNVTNSILITGRVQPYKRVDVRSPIPGRAEAVLVQEGQEVQKGQVLMRTSSTERAAVVDAARAFSPNEAKHWESEIKPSPIVAPVTGTLIQRNVEPGQTFSESDNILVIAERMVVEAPVDETDIARIHPGDPATIVLDAYPDTQISASVVAVSYEAAVVENVTTYMIKVAMDQVPEFVRVGMTANVRMENETHRGVTLVPSHALRATGQGMTVLVPPDQGRKPVERPVKIGFADGKKTEIVEGLVPGEIVLIPEARKAKPARTFLQTTTP